MEISAAAAAPMPCWGCGRAQVRLNRCWFRKHAGGRVKALFCSSSIPDSRNKSWSDSNLAKELREFMAATGLPSDKVPTTNELSNNGRQDLANVVRRRGYKAIAQLLATTPFNPSKAETVESVEVAEEHPENIQSEEKNLVMNGSARVEKEFGGQQKLSHELEYLDLIRPTSSDTAEQSDSSSDLEEKAKHFLRTGRLTDTDESDDETSEEESSDATELQDGASEAVALKKAVLLRSKLLPFIDSRERTSAGKERSEKLTKVHELLQKDKDLQSQSKAQLLDDPKAALQVRDKELTALARELNEAKAQLALVQAKTTAELAQAKQVFIEKDMRLSVAENALTNLKQVKIEWWGNASKVELAGSFNGWQHFFVLEPDLSSEIGRSDGTRGPLMWETELWLYPGIYEMKFIVDGEWQIDHRREVEMTNMNQNNILRVEL